MKTIDAIFNATMDAIGTFSAWLFVYLIARVVWIVISGLYGEVMS